MQKQDVCIHHFTSCRMKIGAFEYTSVLFKLLSLPFLLTDDFAVNRARQYMFFVKIISHISIVQITYEM